MKNKDLQSRMMHRLRALREEFKVNRNSVIGVQTQVDTILDMLELVIVDDDLRIPVPQTRNMAPGAPYGVNPYHPQNRAAAVPQFVQENRPPTVQEAQQMDVPATQETQVFYMASGIKVVPPGYLGIPPFMLPPGSEVPHFPSLLEYQTMQRQRQPQGSQSQGGGQYDVANRGVGSPSNLTTMGQHPSGPPPGAAAVMSPAMPQVYADSIPNPPLQPMSTPQSSQGVRDSLVANGIPEGLAHLIGDNTILGEPPAPVRNISGQPVEAFPGGRGITE